ncbi:hypothetical protein D6853_09005 [Butyrivibrio sp. X503]|uniref:hypothetical protein n=1 Tax=Butyrivibrio sp. X503 TaxID=2364878 RepID=UPI000EA8FEB7|nr:hypothetical protein [Butyrivibrio sp. X503]RKM55684.1 hypothetical protein D6853_09005 [Butyrivibrio sp. X503]
MSDNKATSANPAKDFPFIHASLLVVKLLLDGIMKNESYKRCYNEKFAAEIVDMNNAAQDAMQELINMIFSKAEMRTSHSLPAFHYINEVYSNCHKDLKKKMLEEYESLVDLVD